MAHVCYTDADKRLLIEAYQKGGLHAAYCAMPRRSEMGIRDILTRLGYHAPTQRIPWTLDQEALLCKLWRQVPRVSVKTIAMALLLREQRREFA